MTATELYPLSIELQAFLTAWERDRRCPLELVDYLLEQGLESQAECARWCAVQPDLEVLMPIRSAGERGGKCGPFPTMSGMLDGTWIWDIRSTQHIRNYHPHTVFLENAGAIINPKLRLPSYPSAKKAIMALLDNWIPTTVSV